MAVLFAVSFTLTNPVALEMGYCVISHPAKK